MEPHDQPSRRMAELIDSLNDRTRAGAIRWKRTDRPDGFAYAIRTGGILVSGPSPRYIPVLAPTYRIRVLDQKGDTIEEYESAAPNGTTPLRSLVDLVWERADEGSPFLDEIRREVEAVRA